LQHSLAVLDSDVRQGSSTAILSSTRQQCRLPAAQRTPPTQQPVHCNSDIAKAKNRKHKRSFPHMLQTSQCTCENIRQHSQDHVPCHAFPPKSASGANIFGTCKRHARMRRCKPQHGSPLWRTRSTSLFNSWPLSKRPFLEIQDRALDKEEVRSVCLCESRATRRIKSGDACLYLRAPGHVCMHAARVGLILIAVHTLLFWTASGS
jgi:hypothetical protein